MTSSKVLAHLSIPVSRWTVIAAVAILCALKFAIVPAFYDFSISTGQLPFGFGAPTEAVASTGSLRVCPPPSEQHRYCTFAGRMPLIPYAFAGASKLVGNSVLTIAMLKTALLDLLLLYYLARFLAMNGTDRFLLVLLPAVVAGPQFMLHSFSPFYEEGFLIQLLAVLIIIQLAYVMGREHELAPWARLPAYVVIASVIYLLKSSMIVVVAWSIVFLFCFVRSTLRVRFVAALGMCLPVLIWGAAVDRMTGRFTVGTSIDGLNLLEGNNPATANFYPYYSLDLVIGDGPIELGGRMIERLRLEDLDPRFAQGVWTNEWEPDDALRAMAIAWVIRHPIEELKLLIEKIEVFFFAIRNSPMLPSHDKPPMAALTAGMAWMASMRIMLWFAITAAAFALWRPMPERAIGICCLGFLAAYAAPYIVGYAFERHVVPVLLPSALFLGCLWRFRLNRSATVLSAEVH